eukprot:CAMPEP_0115085660 /NCGR_PEP_ID=MMETSP0227-20121206/22076_1 /TAXON_ID=89957 /ORGANISM="Polarella glacialis, Strain CCMP 1383" /LENGTH=265 /DNA_ID=CAMNT_0002474877 /DNA_START=78 /DNA_END=873 /DNA_ORIENTATION=+
MTNHQQLKAPLLPLEGSKSPSASPSSASPVSTKSDEEATKLRRAICVSLCLMVIEIIGGILANSLAIITDAMHLLSDVGGFALSLLALHFMKQQATAKYSFGFHQAGSLGGLISVMLVWILAGALLVQATHRMFEPEPVDGPVMSGIATLGFLANVLMYAVLGQATGAVLAKVMGMPMEAETITDMLTEAATVDTNMAGSVIMTVTVASRRARVMVMATVMAMPMARKSVMAMATERRRVVVMATAMAKRRKVVMATPMAAKRRK